MSEVTKVSVSEVYLIERRGAIVKHFKRSDEPLTMCGKELDSKIAPGAVNRLCVICDRWRRAFDDRQALELALLAKWNSQVAGQDAPGAPGESCPRHSGNGCAFGALGEGAASEG